MNIYRPTFKDRKTGRTKPTPRWYMDFRDHLDRRQRFKAFESKDDTEHLGRLIEELCRCRRRKTTPDGKWLDRLDTLDKDIQRRLLDLDIVLPSWASITRTADTLSTWADQFEQWLSTSRSRSGYLRNPVHVSNTITRIKSIMAGCRFRQWQDIQPARIETYLGGLAVSAATHTAYVVAIRHFVRWCIRNGLATTDPLTYLTRPAAQSKESRRPLDASEVRPLLEATLGRGTRYGLPAMDRAVLYCLGLVTGFRRNELAHLTPESFDLKRGTVRLAGAHTKDHRDAVQPLPVAMLDSLRAFLAGKDPKTRIWDPLTKHTYAMIRKDATAAGLRIEDQDGAKLCFHSLRHSLRSWLVRAKVVESIIDDILRHKPPSGSTGRRYYTHITDEDRRTAIESLPSIPWPADLDLAKADTRSRQSVLL